MFKKSLYIVGAVIMSMLIGLASFPDIAIATGGPGCIFQGSWYGLNDDGGVIWTSSVQGQSTASGTIITDKPGLDLTYNGYFPVVKSTPLKGTWERSGSNTFRFTMIILAVDENGSTVYTGKLSGTDTLIDNCNTEFIQNTMEIYLGDKNPFVDPLDFVIPLNDHYGYRMRVDPEYQP
jgi:hypothetical protein